MSAPRAVAFDLDGTLIDTRADIAAACNHALVKSGRRPLAAEVIARYVGDGARRLVARATGLGEADPELEPIVRDFVAWYLEHPVVQTTWMPHCLELLDELGQAHIPMAVCTNKPGEVARRVLFELGLLARFVTVVGGGDTQRPKPSAEPLLLAAARLEVAPGELIIVGDGPQDVLAGKAAGARTIAVTGGFAETMELRRASPDALVDTLAEVKAVIAGWVQGTWRPAQ